MHVLSEETHKARISHRCIWCGGTINRGETYRRYKVIYEGCFHDNKFHPECDDACLTEAREEGGFTEFMPYSNERPDQKGQHERD